MVGLKINLIFLVPGKQRGGCTSYLVHLVLALQRVGYETNIYRLGKKTLPRQSDIGYGLKAQVLSLEDLLEEVDGAPSVVVYSFWKHYGEEVKRLLKAGAKIIVHDPAEFYADAIWFFKRNKIRPLVIRKTNAATLFKQGIRARFAPHPYVPFDTKGLKKVPYRAVSVTRLDFRKHTEMIVRANKRLKTEWQIQMYGECNRRFTYFTLDEAYPGWKENYHGSYPMEHGVAVKLLYGAKFAVDLTRIAKDGGGTQYAFFEAWNAGVPLIVNRSWLLPGSPMKEGHNVLAVSSAKELYDIINGKSKYPEIVENGFDLMTEYNPKDMGARFLDLVVT